MSFLNCLPGQYEVVAVVGRFHSGKSFLLNKLARLPGLGFEMGHTTKPTTEGLWV